MIATLLFAPILLSAYRFSHHGTSISGEKTTIPDGEKSSPRCGSMVFRSRYLVLQPIVFLTQSADTVQLHLHIPAYKSHLPA